MLNVISQHGRNARARDILAAEGPEMFRAALADLLMSDVPQRIVRGSCDAVGTHRLGDGSLACGVGLAFGHADAPALGNLADAAKSAGAGGMRAAPGRALLIIGLRQEAASSFAAAVERLGFIVRAGDRRRRVIACAGAPICASAHIAARAMAPDIAATAAPFLDGAFTIHLSGCAKGCAHPAPAALTIVGTADGCALVANGSSRGVPLRIAATDELAAAVTRYAREVSRKDGHV
jgi:precorrin-3B synthase